MMADNEIKQNRATAPVLLYIACTIGIMDTVPTLQLRFTEFAYMVGRWYTDFLLISSVLIWLSLIAIWKLKKWGAFFYVFFATATEIILFKYNIMWAYTSFIIPILATALIFIQFKKMSASRHLPVLLFCLLMINAAASGQSQKQKEQSQGVGAGFAEADKLQAYKQLIRDSIPKPQGYVNDYENIYTEREEAVLDSLIRAFENKTTIQIAVISFDTTMATRDSLDVLIVRIGNAWGVGLKDKNNGVVIGISRGYRRITIRNGYGIEKILSNEETKQIIDRFFIPEFRESRYFEGTYNGLVELMRILGERNE